MNAPGANIATQSLSVDPVESIEAIKLQVGFIGFPPLNGQRSVATARPFQVASLEALSGLHHFGACQRTLSRSTTPHTVKSAGVYCYDQK